MGQTLINNRNVLIIEDDEVAVKALVRSLANLDSSITFNSASTEEEAFRLVKIHRPQAVILDLCLDNMTGPEGGLKIIENLLLHDQTLRILVLTGHGVDEFGIRALQLGAASFLNKPVDSTHLYALISDAISSTQIKRNYIELQSQQRHIQHSIGLQSKNLQMNAVLEMLSFASTTTQPVLLCGETGTGKGVLAQALHRASSQGNNAFIRFSPRFGNADLVSSELFGHERGAFTGATESRRGLIEEASGGTLFIDEVDEIPRETQILLLQVLQEKSFRRLGSNSERKSNFRLIAATNAKIEELLEKNKLRIDFYHRIAHCTIEIPPLRSRTEDISDLASHFVQQVANSENLGVQGIGASALPILLRHTWPGNVRELYAVIEGSVYHAEFSGRRFIEAEDIKLYTTTRGSFVVGNSFREKVKTFEQKLVMDALEKHNYNQTRAAESLQLDRTTLRRILAREAEL